MAECDHNGEASRHHHHSHREPRGGGPESLTLRAFLLTAGFMVVEAVGGLFSGSLALIADSAHMLTDALALALAWLAFRLARRAADPRRTYGYRRLEVLAALTNGILVVGLAVWIVWEAAGRLKDPQPILGLPMLAVAGVGLLVNVLVLRSLHQGHVHENLNLKGAALHVLGDMIGSAAAVVGALIVLWTGWTPIDPILSIGVAVLIIGSAVRLIASAAHILLEGTPEGFDEARVRMALSSLPGVRDVHHIHAWSLTSGQALVTLHATVSDGAATDAVLSAVKQELAARFDLHHSVIQLERAECPDGGDTCA